MTLEGNPGLVDTGFDAPPNNPLVKLQLCLETATKLGVSEPRGLVLSTVDRLGRPSSRVVLIKECDVHGVIFATSHDSAKGRDMAVNCWAAGTLWWRETVQQINFQGVVTSLSDATSDSIFGSRCRAAQAVAALSKQSADLVSGEERVLREEVQALIDSKITISRPDDWHAYHIALSTVEFWYGNKDRFHKRLRYDLVDNLWTHRNLQP